MPTRVLGRTIAAFVAPDRLNVNDKNVLNPQLRRSTRTNWMVWPGVKVRVPAVLPGLGTPT